MKAQDVPDVMIEFRDVSKKYGRVTAVEQISFQVTRGEICGFLGPNGAGKTTSLRMLLGLVKPTSGRVRIQGIDVHQNTTAALDGVGAIIEESHFYPYLTGEQNLRQILRLRGIAATPQQIQLRLQEVGLGEAARRRVKGYSLGMRQRLALALAQLQDPVVLILDEPMNGLDPAAMREFRMHLLALAQSGVTVLLSSHILSEVEQLATRLVFINHGRVMGIEDRRVAHAQTYIRAVDGEALESWLQAQGLMTKTLDDGARVMELNSSEVSVIIRQLVQAGVDLLEIRPYRDNLESQYMEHMNIPEEGSQHAEA